MDNLKEFHNPESLKSALELLAQPGEGIYPLGGGTSISISENKKIIQLVNLDNLGLNYIKDKGGRLVIGAMTTAQDIIDSTALNDISGTVLKKCAKTIGSQQIRNAVTLGGNTCGLFVWSDMPAMLLASNAEIHLASKENERKISAEQFFLKHPAQILKKGEICIEVSFPKLDNKYLGEFIKFSRTNFDKTIMNVCVFFYLKEKKIRGLKIAVSGCISLPRRLKELESKLEGNAMDEKLPEKIIKEASVIKENLNFISDMKASKQYRKKIFETIILDAIMGTVLFS